MRGIHSGYDRERNARLAGERYLFGLLLLGAVVAAPASLADEGGAGGLTNWYATGTIGPAGLDDGGDSDNGFAIGGALGKRFTSPFRGEIAFTYQEAELDGDDESYAFSVFANGFYDFSLDSSLTPYIGVGFGPVFTGREDGGDDDEDTDLGFNLIGGASLAFSETIDFIGQYRYLNTSGFVDEVHAVEVGMRYNF